MNAQEIREKMGSNIPPIKGEPRDRVAGTTPPKTWIVLEEVDAIPQGGQFFQLNGVPYLLQAGVEVEVPQGIIEILDHAVESKPIIDQKSRQVVGYRDRHRFPYRIVKNPKALQDMEAA